MGEKRRERLGQEELLIHYATIALDAAGSGGEKV